MWLSSAVSFAGDDAYSSGPLACRIAKADLSLNRSIRWQVGCRLDLCRSLRKVWKPSVRRSVCWNQML